MSLIPGNVLIILGLAGLGHTAFSVVQHRMYLKVTEQEFTGIPADITLQCLISLLLCCYGVVKSKGNFSEIRATTKLAKLSFDSLSNRSSFRVFRHRGQALYNMDVPALGQQLGQQEIS